MLQFHFTDKQFYLLKSLPIFTERHEIDLVEYAVSMMKKLYSVLQNGPTYLSKVTLC